MWVPHQFRESLRELLRELWFSHCTSRERPFREWDFIFREWNFELRELLREYPGTLPELREWPFHSESVFPEIGVVPRLLILGKKNIFVWLAFIDTQKPETRKPLGQPICRTKLPRKVLISKPKMVRKTTRNFPEKF